MTIPNQLLTAAGYNARARARLQKRYRGRVPVTLKGLACNCVREGVKRGLSGYRLTRLHGYRLTVLSDSSGLHGLRGLGAEPAGTLALEPVSDRKAVMAAVELFQRARGNKRRKGLGDAQAEGAVSGAAAGAKAGSVIPGVGTVIGAVVGAVAGWISGKKPPVRPSAAQVAECRALVSEYMSFAAQSPNAPIPLDQQQLTDLNWCHAALHGPDIGLRDPRWFNPGFTQGVIPLARQVVKKIYETPVGQVVSLDALSFKDPKGRTISFRGFSFTNPQFTDLKSFNAQYFSKAMLEFCQNTAGKGAGGCANYYAHPEWQRLMYDLLAWAARTELPNISEADLRAASQVAADTGSAAKDVVTAVESILERNVVRGETSLLLTGQTDTPVPTTQPGAPPGTPPTPVSTLPEIPGLTEQTAGDITALIKSLLGQGQPSNDVVKAALDALARRGVDPAAAQPAVQQEVAAQAGPSPWLVGGGIALAGLFLFAVPTRKVRRK